MRLYELGNVYLPKALPLTELPEERMQFTLGMYGEGDFFTMKGVVEEFFEKVGLNGKKTYDPNARSSLPSSGTPGQTSIMTERGWDIWERYTRMWRTAYGIGTKAYVAVIDMPEVTCRCHL